MYDKDEIDDQDVDLEEDFEEPEADEDSEAENDDDSDDLDVSDSDDDESDEDDEDGEANEDDDEADDGLVVDLGGDDDNDGENDTKPMRSLRKANRELTKKIRELEKKGADAPDSSAQELGPKPKLADFDYDDEKHESALVEWHDRKREIEAQKEADQEKAQEAQEVYQARFDGYQSAKAELKVKDFDDAEDAVRDSLSTVQQSVIIAHAKQPEVVIYALGKNPKQAAELATETDPIAFAVKVTRLEENMKVTGTKKPKPERKQSKAGAPQKAAPQVGSKKLTAAFAEGQKSGNFDKYHTLRRQRNAQK